MKNRNSLFIFRLLTIAVGVMTIYYGFLSFKNPSSASTNLLVFLIITNAVLLTISMYLQRKQERTGK